VPIEPPPTPWVFPAAAELSALPAATSPTTAADDQDGQDASDLVAIGADLASGTLLAAYRSGLFPMPEGRRSVGWWCPAYRGVLELADLRVSRSLRRSLRDFEIRVDTAFADVVAACADPSRPHGWIDARIQEAYADLHRLGWAHSVEAWRDDRLVGGLYGVAVGGLFAGESMFHHERDASKAALVALVRLLRADQHGAAGRRLIDVQWATPHLRSLGVTTRSRAAYLSGLPALVAIPDATFGAPPG
jgi:leucyl/phenylalanyl-tRNA--protein transferase